LYEGLNEDDIEILKEAEKYDNGPKTNEVKVDQEIY
jgi:hypothetical protein